MDYIASFISENASFFSTYGNWVLIPLLILIFFIDHRFTKHISNKLIRSILKIALIVAAFGLGSLIYMTNFPLKPMVNSIAKVNENIGQPVYDFDFVDVRADGKFSISDFQGKLIILNFWGTYCGPCIEEFPDLKKVESNYPDQVSVIALSDENKERILSFVQRVESPAIVGSFSSEKWIELENFRPLTIIIDKDGIVRDYTFGKKDYPYFKSAIEKYL
ncbi:MAG: TlpA disulfide reductase family protein [Bacteroidota bacterium]